MGIILHRDLGQALLIEDMDNNFDYLDKRPDGQIYPPTKGLGLRIDHAVPDFGWHDLKGMLRHDLSLNPPVAAPYQGNIVQSQVTVGQGVTFDFHLPHDYAPNTDIYVHVHWSHNSAFVGQGSVVWQVELTYAKGHNQGHFNTPILVNIAQDASPVRYQHMVGEVVCSSQGGLGGLLPTEDLEPDGLVLAHVTLVENTILQATDPFIHTVDIHYQSTCLPTKNKSPNFWGA